MTETETVPTKRTMHTRTQLTHTGTHSAMMAEDTAQLICIAHAFSMWCEQVRAWQYGEGGGSTFAEQQNFFHDCSDCC